jgi:hypothetical protein
MRLVEGWTAWIIFGPIARFRREVAEYRALLGSEAANICNKFTTTRYVILQKSAVLFSELYLFIYASFYNLRETYFAAIIGWVVTYEWVCARLLRNAILSFALRIMKSSAKAINRQGEDWTPYLIHVMNKNV